jgi:hypothetical protein
MIRQRTEQGVGTESSVGRCCSNAKWQQTESKKEQKQNNGNNRNKSSKESKNNKSINNERNKNDREKKCRTIVVIKIKIVGFVRVNLNQLLVRRHIHI